MFVKKITLTHFRNYQDLEFEFAPITLFLGNNAQGKTNLLDAVYFLATTKSVRADKDSELIKKGESFVRVEGQILENSKNKDDSDLTNLEIVMQNSEAGFSKRVKVNGVAKRVTDYIGNLVVVPFYPEDINLVTGSPSLRRWHIDLFLAQIDREYKRSLTVYSDALVARNRILKRIREGIARIDELEYWTEQILIHGEIVSAKRGTFFEFLKTTPKRLGNFHFEYKQSVVTKERLLGYQDREIASCSTLIGPHRDDFLFFLDENDLSQFGSRGEQRTAVLELKLQELEYIHQHKGIEPILVLDDVFSELDANHREQIVEVSQRQQTILSGIEGDMIPSELLKQSKVVRVVKGQLSFDVEAGSKS